MIFVVIVLIIVVIGLALDGFFIVKQQSLAAVERFGKFNRIARQGLNLKIPIIDRIAGRSNLRIQQLGVSVEN